MRVSFKRNFYGGNYSNEVILTCGSCVAKLALFVPSVYVVFSYSLNASSSKDLDMKLRFNIIDILHSALGILLQRTVM